jgi:hypothetical protein
MARGQDDFISCSKVIMLFVIGDKAGGGGLKGCRCYVLCDVL